MDTLLYVIRGIATINKSLREKGMADLDAVKSGAIKKFVVMAGCDGRMKSRSYYTEFAQALPKDTIILTAGCAIYVSDLLYLASFLLT